MNKFNNLPELFYYQADKNENNQHLLKLDSNNRVFSMSWLETKNLTKKIHNFLANKYLGDLNHLNICLLKNYVFSLLDFLSLTNSLKKLDCLSQVLVSVDYFRSYLLDNKIVLEDY